MLVLLSGFLHRDPAARQSKAGRQFVTALVWPARQPKAAKEKQADNREAAPTQPEFDDDALPF
jgi:hypothetical protein